MAVKEKVLTLSQLIALQSIDADIARLVNKKAAIMTEAGLDPTKKYSMTPEGVVTEPEDS